ncbi:MAG: response regulator, partial [Bacteroidota bacterium]
MKALIVDDERLARKDLIQLLAKFPKLEVIGEAQDAIEAEEKINELQPDVVFLDIQMPGKSGFELLEELQFPPAIIFVTAHDEHALKAFEVSAMDYLMKPVEPKRLEDAVDKLLSRWEATSSPVA